MATMTDSNPFMLTRSAETGQAGKEPAVHVYGKLKDRGGRVVCVTEEKGRPKNRDVRRNEIVVGIGNIIPLWTANTTLYWRFNPESFSEFADPDAARARIRTLLDQAISRWEDSCPIGFEEREQGWDFEIVVRNSPDCSAAGCVLASAFFPDAGRHKLTIYPTMFDQDEEEQVETLIHELGHVFGLRHFFANVSETQEPSEIFGTHVEFSIMNYGTNSRLTPADKSDLKKLYALARTGELRAINGTPVRLMRPFSSIGL